ncbi:hypothetical protein WJX81_003557 [Elliptochloris bilobata]|uniref:Uncharacterized protein n=1 Tax=Elliptochloris bilobata TaxID=381761 RepID=A0AAW1QXC3_9CHLO
MSEAREGTAESAGPQAPSFTLGSVVDLVKPTAMSPGSAAGRSPSAAPPADAPARERSHSWAAVGAATPPGMDAAAYAAGERAALARAFQLALPGQQALGGLQAGLAALRAAAANDSAALRATQADLAGAAALLQAVVGRLDALEGVRLPALDARLDAAATAPVSQEFRVTLDAMREVLGALAAAPAKPAGVLPGAASLGGSAAWAVRWAGGWAQWALARADVAAVALSRRVLLDRLELHGPGMPVSADEDVHLAPERARAVVGALLFIAAVESAFQLHQQAMAALPRRLQTAAGPAGVGLKALRGATWAAALTLATWRVRGACFCAADAACLAAQRCRVEYAALRARSKAAPQVAVAAAEVRSAAAAVAADMSAALAPQADGDSAATDLADDSGNMGGVAERLEDLERLEEGRADLEDM